MGKKIIICMHKLFLLNINLVCLVAYILKSLQAYKRVGSMIHNGDKGRGIIGVIEVMDLMVHLL